MNTQTRRSGKGRALQEQGGRALDTRTPDRGWRIRWATLCRHHCLPAARTTTAGKRRPIAEIQRPFADRQSRRGGERRRRGNSQDAMAGSRHHLVGWQLHATDIARSASGSRLRMFSAHRSLDQRQPRAARRLRRVGRETLCIAGTSNCDACLRLRIARCQRSITGWRR